MLSLKPGWSGRTFALARCSNDSSEKKTRRRLSKAERTTMVESFIKKYQDSNNGNFPSLNLTHKEVGGSFYTVREIVREIIQENRVLAPGNPASKALRLEDCFEEYPIVSLSLDPQAIEQEQKEYSLLSSEPRILSNESHEVVSSEPLNLLAYHPNGCPESPIMQNQNSSTTNLDENLTDLDYQEEDLRTPSRKILAHSGADANIYSEVQVHSLKGSNDHNVEHPVLLGNCLSIYTSSEIGVNEYETGSKKNSIARTNLFAENIDVSEITGEELLPETTALSNSEKDDMSSTLQEHSTCSTREVPPFASTAAKTCDSDGSLTEAKGSTLSLEAVGMHCFPHEMETDSMQADKDHTTKRTESTEHLPSRSINGSESIRLSSPMPFTSGSTKIVPTSFLKPSNGTNTESLFCELPFPDANGVPDLPAKAEYEDIASKIEGDSISSSTSEEFHEESEKEEMNPVWAAVKAFVAGVIKFWME